MPAPYQDLVRTLLSSRIVAYYPSLALLTGSVKSAVLLSQLLYLDNNLEARGDWFPASRKQIRTQTGLTFKEQESARALLIKKGLATIKRAGMPAQHFFKVHLDGLAALAAGQLPLPLDPQSPQKGDSRVTKKETHESPKGSNIKESTKRVNAAKGKGSAPPAVEMYRRIRERYPNKKLWPRIDRAVGDEFPALLKWARIVRDWIASGYNPANIKGMLNVFRVGWDSNQHAAAKRWDRRHGGAAKRSAEYDPAADVANYKQKRGFNDR